MLNESRTPKRARTNSKAPIDRVRKTKPLEKISLSPKRKVLTRSRSVKHMRTDSEELNCALAKCIDSDTLKIVCEKLEAKDLVNLIASCQFFKRGRGRDIIDSVSEKVVDDELGECPGFVRCDFSLTVFVERGERGEWRERKPARSMNGTNAIFKFHFVLFSGIRFATMRFVSFACLFMSGLTRVGCSFEIALVIFLFDRRLRVSLSFYDQLFISYYCIDK